MSLWRTLLIASSILAGLSGRAVANDDQAAIHAASQAFSAAYVAGDTTTIRDLYTKDAVLLPPGREVRGASAIVRYFSPISGRKNLSHAMESSELRITGDVAIDIGTWSYAWQREDAEPQSASDRYFVLWRRCEDGRWRIEVDMWHRPAS